MKHQRIVVRKQNSRGEQVFAYEGVVAKSLPTGVRIDAIWERERMDLGYATFEPGDIFIESFFTDRWYNIMEIHDQQRVLKGWYCNITWPAEIEDATITYRDLALDLWVSPDGVTLTLDEDEFEADATLTDEVRAAALAALADLHDLVTRRESPFDHIGHISAMTE